MKKTLLLILIFLMGEQVYAQHQFDYAYGFGDQGQIFTHIVDDSNRNYLFAVKTSNSAPLYVDPQNRQIQTTIQNASQLFFVTVLEADGSYVRSIEVEIDLDIYFPDISVNSKGEIFIHGTFKDQAFLDPQNPTTKTFDIAGQSRVFVAKYDTSGNLVYAKSALNSQGTSFPDQVKLTLLNDDDFQ